MLRDCLGRHCSADVFRSGGTDRRAGEAWDRPVQYPVAGLDAVPVSGLLRTAGREVVHFSEIRFIGNLEPEHLKKVRAYARAKE
jgi:hypothetical protein